MTILPTPDNNPVLNILLFVFLFVLFIFLFPVLVIGMTVLVLLGKTGLIFDWRKHIRNPFAKKDGQEAQRINPRSYDNGEPIDVEATVVSSTEETGEQSSKTEADQ